MDKLIDNAVKRARALRQQLHNLQPVTMEDLDRVCSRTDKKNMRTFFQKVRTRCVVLRRIFTFWDNIEDLNEAPGLSDRQAFELQRLHRDIRGMAVCGIMNDVYFFRRQIASAHGRDALMELLFDEYAGRHEGDVAELKRIGGLREKWDKSDKGRLHKSEGGIQAVKLLRLGHVFNEMRHYAPAKDQSLFERTLSTPLIRSLTSLDTKFSKALDNARHFVTMRRHPPGRYTEEDDPRTDVTFFAILRELYREPLETWKYFLAFAPRYKNDPRNFQGRLRRWGIRFKPAGQFRGKTDNNVYSREKKVHMRRTSQFRSPE
jgi:hypothetical protein